MFGGDFTRLSRFKEIPEGSKLSAGEKEKIMHISLPVGRQNILMGTDAMESMGHKLIPGNNFSLSVSTESKEEAKKIFDGLAAGGKTEMPLGDAFWGAYFGMVEDKFGIRWMVSYEYEQNPAK